MIYKFSAQSSEISDIRILTNADNMSLAIWDIKQILRGYRKHGFHPSENREMTESEYIIAEEIEQKVLDILDGYNVSREL